MYVKLPYCKSSVRGSSGHIVDFRANCSCDNRRFQFFLLSVQWRLLLRPKCGKISIKVHPFYLKSQERWLVFKFEGIPPSFIVMYTRATTETLRKFYIRHGAIYIAVRSRDAITDKIDSLGYIYSNFYEYVLPLCSPSVGKGPPLLKSG